MLNHFPVSLETQRWSLFPEVKAECRGKKMLYGFPARLHWQASKTKIDLISINCIYTCNSFVVQLIRMTTTTDQVSINLSLSQNLTQLSWSYLDQLGLKR